MKKNINKFCILNGDRSGNHFEGEIMKLPNRLKVKKERFFSLFTCIFSETYLLGKDIEKILDKQRSCIRTKKHNSSLCLFNLFIFRLLFQMQDNCTVHEMSIL